MVREQNLIGGHWVPGADGATAIVTDPGDGGVIGEVPASGPVDTIAAIDAAAASLPAWAHRTAAERSAVVRRLFELVIAHSDDIARTISTESGKPLAESEAEVRYGAGFLEWAAEEGKRLGGETIPATRQEQRIMVLRQPIGVTAAITPWNFPLAMLTRKLGPALAAGCTQILKPAEQTPLTAVLLCRLAEEAGVPAGVVNLLHGPGEVIANALLDDPRVRKLSFTGSTEVGRHLVQRSATNLTRLSLELGGHAPLLVLDDADLEVTIGQALRAKFRNAGQSCIAANRFYVARPLYEEFADRFAKEVSAMTVGHWREHPDIGPLIDDRAVAKANAHVEDAIARGAVLTTGGRAAPRSGGPSRYFEPTVLRDVTDDMLLSQEETFAPIAGLSVVDSDDEAIERANASPYGLAAYVFGRDVGRVLRTAERLEYGVIGINDGVPSTPQAPFGGMKLSGIGREGGHFVMDHYVETKYVSLAL